MKKPHWVSVVHAYQYAYLLFGDFSMSGRLGILAYDKKNLDFTFECFNTFTTVGKNFKHNYLPNEKLKPVLQTSQSFGDF